MADNVFISFNHRTPATFKELVSLFPQTSKTASHASIGFRALCRNGEVREIIDEALYRQASEIGLACVEALDVYPSRIELLDKVAQLQETSHVTGTEAAAQLGQKPPTIANLNGEYTQELLSDLALVSCEGEKCAAYTGQFHYKGETMPAFAFYQFFASLRAARECEDEVKLYMRFNEHDDAVKIYYSFIEENQAGYQVGIVMEMCERRTLLHDMAVAKTISPPVPYDVQEMFYIVMSTITFFAKAAAMGMHHGNITPGALFLTEDGRVKVGYYTCIGSRAAAPSEKKDVWALGVTLLHLMKIEEPGSLGTEEEIVSALRETTNYPDVLRYIVYHMLRTDEGERYTFKQLKEMLSRAKPICPAQFIADPALPDHYPPNHHPNVSVPVTDIVASVCLEFSHVPKPAPETLEQPASADYPPLMAKVFANSTLEVYSLATEAKTRAKLLETNPTINWTNHSQWLFFTEDILMVFADRSSFFVRLPEQTVEQGELELRPYDEMPFSYGLRDKQAVYKLGDIVYMFGGESQENALATSEVCFDGKWHQFVTLPVAIGFANCARSGAFLYIAGMTNHIVKFDPMTNQVNVVNIYLSGTGYAVFPTLEPSQLLYLHDNTLYRVNPETGHQIGKSETGFYYGCRTGCLVQYQDKFYSNFQGAHTINAYEICPNGDTTFTEREQKISESLCSSLYVSPEKIDFSQRGECDPASIVVMHEPQIEAFLSGVNPTASLFMGPVDQVSISKAFSNLSGELMRRGIQVYTVRSALKRNRIALERIALNHLEYVSDFDYPDAQKCKQEVIETFTDDQLVDLILIQPTVNISKTGINTGLEYKNGSIKPLGNMVFCRDQQITTNKGVVIAAMHASQRAMETVIMNQVWTNLGANIIGRLSDTVSGTLEGGDFFPVSENLAMLGVGLRTNQEAADYLLDNDLFGTSNVALVHDREDCDQERMHLDTYFNILSDKDVLLLDFDTVEKSRTRDIRRTVDIYTKGVNGRYTRTKQDLDFETWLREDMGYNVIKVTNEEQLNYMINFLNIGNFEILAVNPGLEAKIAGRTVRDVKVTYVDFSGIM